MNHLTLYLDLKIKKNETMEHVIGHILEKSSPPGIDLRTQRPLWEHYVVVTSPDSPEERSIYPNEFSRTIEELGITERNRLALHYRAIPFS
jgi:hypothetical protein